MLHLSQDLRSAFRSLAKQPVVTMAVVMIYGGASLALIGLATAVSMIPARLAARIDPVVVLRQD